MNIDKTNCQLKEFDSQLKERDPVTYWPTAF